MTLDSCDNYEPNTKNLMSEKHTLTSRNTDFDHVKLRKIHNKSHVSNWFSVRSMFEEQ